jgi:hypothetical protein
MNNEEILEEIINKIKKEKLRWPAFHELEKTVTDAESKIFYTATGALALSITFKDTLAPQYSVHILALKFSWLALAFCIVAHIIRLRLIMSFWSNVLERNNFSLSKRRKSIIDNLSLITNIFFTAGIVLLTYFAWVNT